MDTRIYNRIATCGRTHHALATPTIKGLITDAARSSARFLRAPRHVIRTGRDDNAPGYNPHDVRYPWDNSPVLIGGIGVSPAIGHSGNLQVFNK